MLPRNLLIISVSIFVSWICHQKATERRFASLIAEGMDQVVDSYVRPVERRALFEAAMRGMIQELDPYSEYISPDDLSKFQELLDQEFGGIGIMVEKDDKGYLVVSSPLFETPAYEAGLLAGDRIVEIEGKDTREVTIEDSIKLMRGRPGSPVALKILRVGKNEPESMSINRAIIQVESVAGDVRHNDGSWDFRLASDRRIGYVRISKFGKQTADELSAVLRGFPDDVQGLILDLRGNAGGLLDSAVQVCDYFLDEGVIVTTRGRDAERILEEFESRSSDTLVPASMPVVVLINHYSASASEIVSACLQDYHRAVVVGDRSWGKGTVQNIIHLEGGRSALRLTTATYWRPSGKNIHRNPDAKETDSWGVMPDEGYAVTVTEEEAERIARDRRQRDVLRPPGSSTTPHQTAPESSPSLPPTPPVIDTQLQRAVEYLHERFTQTSGTASTDSAE